MTRISLLKFYLTTTAARVKRTMLSLNLVFFVASVFSRFFYSAHLDFIEFHFMLSHHNHHKLTHVCHYPSPSSLDAHWHCEKCLPTPNQNWLMKKSLSLDAKTYIILLSHRVYVKWKKNSIRMNKNLQWNGKYTKVTAKHIIKYWAPMDWLFSHFYMFNGIVAILSHFSMRREEKRTSV